MKLRISAAELVAEARSQIPEVDTLDALEMFKRDDVVVVDIRDVRERNRTGWIPGSVHAPRGMLEFWVDPDSPYFKEIFGEDRKFVLHCAAGWRSALSAATLCDMGFEAAHLEGGFAAWKEAGEPVEMPKPRD